jgi:hypothetical protein
MKPFRKNVALAIDGGGIRGIMVARALQILEDEIGQSAHQTFRLVAGTSTGSILSAGIATGLTAGRMVELYQELGKTIFRKSWRTLLWPLSHYRYPLEPLEGALRAQLGEGLMGDFWTTDPPTDVVITSFDLKANRTRFIKSWKDEYKDWPVVKAVLASSAVPTYFPVIEGRYIDGGVGSYGNPCYLAAYELLYLLDWDPAETTLVSLGTGRQPHSFSPEQAQNLWPWGWIEPILGAFMQSADDQQVHLVENFFEELDFRRFQVDLRENIGMDDPEAIPTLLDYGDALGHMLIYDMIDPAQEVTPHAIPTTSP